MSKISFCVNGTQIEAAEGQSVLNAALNAGFYIPHLCAHPDLTPQGGCKLCVVEVDGDTTQPMTSCTLTVREGMRVVTKSENLGRLRRAAVEFMLAGHPHDCTGCRSFGNCELQAMMQYLSVAHSRMKDVRKVNTKRGSVNPLIDREMERCIQCGRCVRACQDLRGVGVLDYQKKNDEAYIGTENDLPLSDAGCRFCGACVAVCPTGALQDREGVFRKDVPREQALIPCQTECPAGIDIPRYIRLVHEGKCGEAVAVIREKVPFPHALGYVCTRFCEKGCKRTGLDEPISIRNLKRYAVEHDETQMWKQNAMHNPPTGKKVAVIGGGPAGLTAGYYLARKGHEVTVFERLPAAGGMLAHGIPSYRLPRADLQKEVDVIAEAGVTIQTNIEVKNVAALKAQGYDAVLVAVGASAGKVLPLDGYQPEFCMTAVDLLREVSLGNETPLVKKGRTVSVLGGGNVAFDAARVARRLGADVNVVCLEARSAMLADEEEVVQASEEGVVVYPGKSNLGFVSEGGRMTGLKTVDISSFRFDHGKLVTEAIAGTEAVIPADTILFAAGQRIDLTADFGLELNRFGYPVYDAPKHTTAIAGVYVAGDVVTGTKSVVDAIEGGRQAASEIDVFLGGDGDISEALAEKTVPGGNIGRVDGFAGMGRNEAAIEAVKNRCGSFCMADFGLNDEQAACESTRCLQCDLRNQIQKPKLWTAYASK